jgi:hypothetical protein
MDTLLAEVSGGPGLVQLALQALILAVCLLIVFALGKWAIGKFKLSENVQTCWLGFFLLMGAIIAINFLLGLSGHSFIHLW